MIPFIAGTQLDSFQAIPACQFNPANLTTAWKPVFAVDSSGAITDISQANPAVVTSVAHGLVTGSVVKINGVIGMTQLNGNSYVITVIDANSFSLNGVNSLAYTAYISGGIWQCSGGFADNIKILEIYNGGAVAIDYSFDGITQHGTWPSAATLVIDLQTNHNDNPPYGSGTLYGRAGQNVWVRTATNPTFLIIGGVR